tara:strand:- start:13397 stop:14338 length:942 start_codon:yes stop_codon:yes gene_type:complete
MKAEINRFNIRTDKFASVSADSNVITGVSVITQGPALGHGVQIDEQTLLQVKQCAESYSNGLKVKMTHEGDAGDIIGRLTNFRIDGSQLLADLYLLKSSPMRDYIIELAETIPDTFGLSIAFSGPTQEIEGQNFARCSEIYSADLVSEPAANPSGLFDVGPLSEAGDDSANEQTMSDNPNFVMNPEEIKKVIDEAMLSYSDRLSKLEASIVSPAEEMPEIEVEMKEQLSKVADEAANKAFKMFAAQFGTQAVSPSAESKIADKEVAKTFEQLVKDHAEYGVKKSSAVADIIAKHPQAHRDYLARVHGGEVVIF